MKANTLQQTRAGSLIAALATGEPGRRRRQLALAVACLGLSGSLMAAPVTVPDFSFENTPLSPGGATAAPYVGTNWSASGNGGVYIQNITNTLFTPTGLGLLPAPADGTNYLVANMNGHTAYAWQNVGLLQSNTVYTLTIAVGQSLLGSIGTGEIGLVNGTSPFGTILAKTAIDNSTLTPGTFADSTVTFTNGYQASGNLTILMEGDSTGTQLCFDNVRLDATPTPQAATALLPSLSTPSGTVYDGTLVTLSENPAGALPFQYQWRTDNGSGGATFTDISGATNPNVVVDTSSFTPNTPVEFVVVVGNSFGTSTSAPVSITAITGAPVVVVDTLPTSGSADVQGSEVTFTAAFDGSRPISYQWQVDNGGGPVPIAGATNTTLTLTNLQFTDSASYSLLASNALGMTISTPSVFTVNPVPTDVNGVIASPANQFGLGGNTEFTPTWVVAPNSLIAGAAPSLAIGNFQLEGSGGIVPLTDGQFGKLPPEGNASPALATCGIVANGAGSTLAYALPASATGWDLTNIVVYGGWSDSGRDQQRYQVYYSTTAAPTNYDNLLADVNFDPTLGTSAMQSASRVTLTGTNGSAMAKNVAGVEFFFNTLASGPENGYEGYAEFQVFGVQSAPAPVALQPIEPGSGSDVVGSEVTLTASFTSITPMTLQWSKDGVPIAGATSTVLTLSNLQFSDTSVSPGYVLTASNASGTVATSPCAFIVNPSPGPDGSGVIESTANQTGNGATFAPTWRLLPGSLIAGALPSSAANGGGSFGNEGCGGVRVLTDDQLGSVGGSLNATLASCGTGAGGTVTYTLSGPEGGYDLTNIVVYGGWSDGGRDEQHYTIYYSTVADPATFIALTAFAYDPTPPAPSNVPTTARVTLTSATGGPLATNVAAVRFDFTNPSGENGWSGYSEIQLFGSASAPLALGPVVTTDTIPAVGSDVVGSQVTFAAGFGGTAPITYQWQKNGVNVPGATMATLTLSNLQLSDSGAYNLVATNIYGTTSSTTNSFTVNPAPAPVNGILIATAGQTSFGAGFTPTWTVSEGSLIAGQTPSGIGAGSFGNEGAGGVRVLTDGAFGIVGAGNATLATGGSGAGSSLTYTLAGGYNLTSIVTYGGWGDGGRDQQHYTVYYSTVSNPTNFIALTPISYDPTPPAPGTVPTADRVTITSASAAPLATSVGMVKFDFTNPSGENGWSGYAEIQLFGTPAAPTIGSVSESGGKLILTGTGGVAGSGYTWLTSTNVTAALALWTTNSIGVFDGTGGFSNAIPIVPSESKRFFRLRIP
ncbi:MAG TPA: immunoglobulin domain-containing protein [Verrucomicrobiae bacterium]|nr:immunoglobulin domain-containing protein [Verrucomicrobiae bacterium]